MGDNLSYLNVMSPGILGIIGPSNVAEDVRSKEHAEHRATFTLLLNFGTSKISALLYSPEAEKGTEIMDNLTGLC